MDMNDFFARLSEFAKQQQSEIAGNIQGRQALIKKVYIDLGTARTPGNPYKISIPFKSVVVEGASDSTAYLNLALGDSSLDAINDAKILKSNDSFEFQQMVSSSYLWWPAQSGKYLTLAFATTGFFRPGSQVSQLAGGVTILDGSSFSQALLGSGGNATSVAISTTAAVILPADTDRKTATLVSSVPAFIGNSAIASDLGVPVQANQPFVIRNTAAIYAITAAGSGLITGVVEK